MAPYSDKQGNVVFFTYSIDAMEAAQCGDVTGFNPGEKKAAKPAPEVKPVPEPVKEEPAKEEEPSEEVHKCRTLRRRGEGS